MPSRRTKRKREPEVGAPTTSPPAPLQATATSARGGAEPGRGGGARKRGRGRLVLGGDGARRVRCLPLLESSFEEADSTLR